MSRSQRKSRWDQGATEVWTPGARRFDRSDRPTPKGIYQPGQDSGYDDWDDYESGGSYGSRGGYDYDPRRETPYYDEYEEYDRPSQYDRQPSGRALKKHHHKLFGWYRVLALVLVVAMVGSTFIFLHGPSALRKHFYPIEYVMQIQTASEDHGISPFLLAAVIQCESGWDPTATSAAGAVGLMQLMPETAQEVAARGLVDTSLYSPDNLTDPATNIQYGAAYLKALIDYYGEVEHAVAAYNAGVGNVDSWDEQGEDIRNLVKFPETSSYLLRVVRSKEAYERIYSEVFPSWSL